MQTLQGSQDGMSTKENDFMSEAKDWAGELISGQTGTGRILVASVYLELLTTSISFLGLSCVHFINLITSYILH